MVDFLHLIDGTASLPSSSLTTPKTKKVVGAFDDVLPGEVIPISQAMRATAVPSYAPSQTAPKSPYPKTAMPDIEQAIVQEQLKTDSMRAREEEHLGAIEVTPPRHNQLKHLGAAGTHPKSLKSSQ